MIIKKYKNLPTLKIDPHPNFTNVKIIGYVEEGEKKKKRPVIEATCLCGKLTQIRLNNFNLKQTKSCGCRLARKHQKSDYIYPEYLPYTSDNHKKYNDYLKRSKANKIQFLLSLDEFESIYYKPCSYCSLDLPGIDRIDSNLGYEVGNIKSCCKYCNRAKHQETEAEFLTWLNRVKGVCCSQQ